MKFLKGNQAIIYIIALMLITAGYLNYTTKNEETKQTTSSVETNSTQVADIGDATLVNSNDVVSESLADSNEETNLNNTTEETSDLTDESKQTNNDNIESSDYFASSKIERDKMYSQMIEVYQNVLNNTSSDEAHKKFATEEIKKINDIKNSTMICENLIKTKGFENSVIFVNGDSINVIVGTTQLEKEVVSEIQNII